MLKEADIKYRDLLRALVSIGASGRIVCESPDQEVDAVLMQKAYRRMLSRAKQPGGPGDKPSGKEKRAGGKPRAAKSKPAR